jgi:hypothetical protein
LDPAAALRVALRAVPVPVFVLVLALLNFSKSFGVIPVELIITSGFTPESSSF